MGKDTTKTSEAKKAGLKKARKKYFSFGLASGLAFHNPESPLIRSYTNSKFCAETITVDPDGMSHSHYCKNRWCPLCQSIRIARLINGYQPQLEQMGEYAKEILKVKPGITGYWHVNGRSNVDFESRLLMDVWYVKNRTLWMDIQLLWQTVGVVLMKKGAK